MSSTCPRTAQKLNSIIINFLKNYNLHNEEFNLWKVKESNVGGLGIFAKRDINVGETIFKDYPVVIGPRAIPSCPLVCVVCYTIKNLKGCERDCGLPICSKDCQDSDIHSKECKIILEAKRDSNNNNDKLVFDENTDSISHEKVDSTKVSSNRSISNPSKNNDDEPEVTDQSGLPIVSMKLFNNVTPIRALLLDENEKNLVASLVAHQSDQHGHEVTVLKDELNFCFDEDSEQFMRLVCCIMDANAFEVTAGEEDNQSSIRGLYPLGSLANHRCYPNTTHVFDNEQKMICRAADFIPKDSEIFTSYSRITWGSVTRLYHLKRTKHFICRCDRCRDPTEFGTYMSAILCKKCRGNVIPINPYKAQEKWQCEDCKSLVPGTEVGQLIQMLGAILSSIKPADFEFMYKLLNGKLRTIVPTTNQVAVELKLKIIWILGHKPRFQGYHDLPSNLLKFKKELCEEILKLLQKLRVGQSKLKGILLYELYCCYKEMLRRKDLTEVKPQLDEDEIILLLEEAEFLLRDDVLALKQIEKCF